jgi:hypothetical protein
MRLSFLHYYTLFSIIIDIHFESFILEILDHSNIGLLEVSYAKLKNL